MPSSCPSSPFSRRRFPPVNELRGPRIGVQRGRSDGRSNWKLGEEIVLARLSRFGTTTNRGLKGISDKWFCSPTRDRLRVFSKIPPRFAIMHVSPNLVDHRPIIRKAIHFFFFRKEGAKSLSEIGPLVGYERNRFILGWTISISRIQTRS